MDDEGAIQEPLTMKVSERVSQRIVEALDEELGLSFDKRHNNGWQSVTPGVLVVAVTKMENGFYCFTFEGDGEAAVAYGVAQEVVNAVSSPARSWGERSGDVP